MTFRSVTIGGNVWQVHEDPRTGPPSYGPSLIFETELMRDASGTIPLIGED